MIKSILFITLFLYSCSSIKRTGETFYKNGNREVYPDVIREQNITNTDFNIQKAEIEIDKDSEKQIFLASLKYRKEGNYILSIRTRSGIEAARFYLTKDTIVINDKIRRNTYYASSSYLNEKYGISTDAFPLLLGDYLNNEKRDDSRLICTNGMADIKERIQNRIINYTIDCGIKKIIKATIGSEDDAENILVSFSNFENHGNSLFPAKIDIKDTSKSFIIRINIEKINFTDTLKLEFIPGKDYNRVLLR
ncbi:MAG: hypothetical protein QG611_673 [Bacteroidota bacterium]|nr:hypothetical protein [Bacteroidota bacterium]